METIKLFFTGFVRGFKLFGYSFSLIINFVLLFFVYFTGVGLTWFFAKIFKKNFLILRSKNRKTFWIRNKITKKSMEEYKRTF
jgi:hypothetical protein